MTMQDINGKAVKLSQRTIKVMDASGKMQGLVKGLDRFIDAPANKQCDYSGKLRRSGLWGSKYDVMDRVYFEGRQLYYIHDARREDNYIRYEAPEYAAGYAALAKAAAQNGINVVRVISASK